MTDRPEFAPGCYGMGSVFSAELKECKSCVFRATCQPLAEARIAKIRDELGVKRAIVQTLERTRLEKRTARPTKLDLKLPKKVLELVERINETGIDVVQSLMAGKNPFTDKPLFLRIACHLALGMPQGVRRDILQNAYKAKLGWSDGTAAAHALQAVQFLKAMGAADEIDGVLKLRKE